ncbi:DUF397 domain-containing protein [Actinocorallia lasiicapitis]
MELASAATVVGVRDSKQPGRGVLVFERATVRELVRGLKGAGPL